MMRLERAVPAHQRRNPLLLILGLALFATFSTGYKAREIYGALSFRTDDLVVTVSANLSSAITTLGDERFTIQADSSTGAQNDFVLSATTTVLVWSGASTATFSGFKCGAATCTSGNANGRHLLVINATSNIMNILNQSGLSTAGNKISTWGAQASAISLSSGDGAAEFVYDGAITSWRMVNLMSGRIDVPLTLTGLLSTAAISASGGITTQSVLNANGNGTHLRGIHGAPQSLTGCGASPTATDVTSAQNNYALYADHGDIRIGDGHFRTQGAAVSFSAGAGCGTNPVCNSTSCNDVSGTFTVGSGTSSCVITFAGTYGGADDAGCFLQAIGVSTVPVFQTDATTLNATTIIASQKYHYFCPGH